MAGVEDILGPCTCIPAYKDRGMQDPQCKRCEAGDDVEDLIDEIDMLKSLLGTGVEIVKTMARCMGVSSSRTLNEWLVAARIAQKGLGTGTTEAKDGGK